MRAPVGLVVVLLALAGCSGAAGGPAATPPSTTPASAPPAAWQRYLHVPGVVDLAGPRTDGDLVVAAGAHLELLDPGGRLSPFAPGYTAAAGEPYVALSSGQRVAGAGCRFQPDDVFALALNPPGGVLRIDRSGSVRPFAAVTGVGPLNGIAFDTTGAFGDRLLVSGPSGGRTMIASLDCRGSVATVTRTAPVMEGGLAVAPARFGAFGGDLIGPDELSGRVVAVRPDGSSALVARSGLPAGGDVGVEGLGFVPAGFGPGGAAYFADRATAGNPHPGTDSLLRLTAAELLGAGVREGDLLAATEGGASLVAIRCQSGCRVFPVAAGPAVAHGEGHVLVVAGGR